MGQALVKVDFAELSALIHAWTDKYKFTITENANENDRLKQLKGKSLFYKATWQCQSTDDGILINLELQPWPYLNVIIHTILFSGLFCSAVLIDNIFDKFKLLEIMLFIVCATLIITSIWWKDSWLASKLTKIEGSFWDMASQTHDSRQLTLTKGKLYTKRSKLLTEIVLSCVAIYICTKFLALLGFVVSALLCIFVIIMIAAELIHDNNPQWHWRFRLIRNVFQWTWLMLSTFAIALVLMSLECFMPLEMYQSKNNFNLIEAIERGRFRNIAPATAEALENNAIECLTKLAKSGTSKTKNTQQGNEASYHFNLYAGSIGLLVIFVIAVIYFIFRPLRVILTSHKTWQREIHTQKLQQIPSILYWPQAWKWRMPIILHVLIFLHYLIGGIINIAASIFCIDGLSYLLTGKTLIFTQTANLYSWIFAASRIVLGPSVGQIVAVVLVVAICLPVLILLAIFVRRFVKNVWLIIRVLHIRTNHHLSSIQNYLEQVCEETGLTDPVIILTKSKNTVVSLHWLAFSNKPVIVLSQGTIKLLSANELKAAIAHELGHIRQGIWKVSLLKFLSSLALFPNYYLTLCMDWAKKEMDADQFAVEVTKDAQSLKQALIKISTAHISYSISTAQKQERGFNRLIPALKRRLHSMMVSVRFFFGDGLFGYAHPYLSERLEAIEAKNIEYANR